MTSTLKSFALAILAGRQSPRESRLFAVIGWLAIALSVCSIYVLMAAVKGEPHEDASPGVGLFLFTWIEPWIRFEFFATPQFAVLVKHGEREAAGAAVGRDDNIAFGVDG